MSTEQSTGATEQAEQLDATTTDGVTDEGADASTQAPKPTADQKKAEIVSSFQKRIDGGEITLEEVRERQPWVAEALETQEEEPANIPDKVKLSLKEELKAELRLESEWDDLEALRLPKKTMDELESNFDAYKESLGEVEALKLAKKLSGVDTSLEANQRRSLRLRGLGGGVEEPVVRVNDFDKQLEKMNPYVKADQNAKHRATLESGQPLILK